MDDTEQLEQLRHYFEDHLVRYTVPDLQCLMDIRPDSDGLSGCTIPLALTAFSVLDLFGYLLRPAKKGLNSKDTKGNLRFIFCESAGGLFPLKVDPREFDVIYELYRNGLVHQYFPKNVGIAKAGLGPLIVCEDSQDGTSGIPVLNVDVLAQATLDLIEKTKCRMLDRNSDNASTRDQFHCRLVEKLGEGRECVRQVMTNRQDADTPNGRIGQHTPPPEFTPPPTGLPYTHSKMLTPL